jgi:hypothetical protein
VRRSSSFFNKKMMTQVVEKQFSWSLPVSRAVKNAASRLYQALLASYLCSTNSNHRPGGSLLSFVGACGEIGRRAVFRRQFRKV